MTRSWPSGMPFRAALALLTKRSLRAAIALLPRGAQLAALEQIAADLGSWTVLGRVARSCGIESVRIPGFYGVIQGAANDSVILAEYARVGHWAKRTNELLVDFFARRGGQYIDIGANIGLTILPVAQNPAVRCLAIEPDPTNFANLKDNVLRNCQHGNVDLQQLAIFSEAVELPLEIAPDNLGDHRLRTRNVSGVAKENGWSTVTVRAAPLDEVAPNQTSHLAIKIDTQGAEPFVFSGGPRTLSAASLVISEWAPYWLARLGGDPKVVTSFLAANFSKVAIAEGESGGLPEPEPVSIATERLLALARQYRNDPSMYVDFVATR